MSAMQTNFIYGTLIACWELHLPLGLDNFIVVATVAQGRYFCEIDFAFSRHRIVDSTNADTFACSRMLQA